MDPEDAALLRCRLHIRGGRILLDHHKITHALGTLFDALDHGLQWYLLVHLHLEPEDLPPDIIGRYRLLQESGISLPESFNIVKFEQDMETALDLDHEPDLDVEELWLQLKSIFLIFGIMPFELEISPEDDPRTREVLGL